MQMARNARSGGAAKVHAEVIALRMIRLLESHLHALRELHHLRKRRGIGCRKLGDVLVGDDHDVPARVGKAIEDDEILLGAKNDQSLRIVVRGDGVAENAALILGSVGDIPVTPRRPKIIHARQPCASGSAETAASPELRGLLTKSFSSLLGLKYGIFFGGTVTRVPVLGLRPVRPRRSRVRKLPKPRISILSSDWRAAIMLSKIVSTTASASLRGSSVTRVTSSTSSAFVTVCSFSAAASAMA